MTIPNNPLYKFCCAFASLLCIPSFYFVCAAFLALRSSFVDYSTIPPHTRISTTTVTTKQPLSLHSIMKYGTTIATVASREPFLPKKGFGFENLLLIFLLHFFTEEKWIQRSFQVNQGNVYFIRFRSNASLCCENSDNTDTEVA